MKFPLLLMFICCLQAKTPAYSQTISLDLTNASLEQVFKEIKKQTGHRFVYARTEIRSSKPVTLSVTNQSLDYVLQAIFSNQPISYVIEDSHVVIRKKVEAPPTNPPVSISGKVVNENGESLPGVTISVKEGNVATATNEKGEFTLSNLKSTDILVITSVGYQSQEIIIGKNEFILVKLSIVINSLDETIVIAYGKTTRRLNTGSISKVGADDISKQPVSNPLAALQGRVPGLLVSQSSGMPGSAIFLQIRGRNSLSQGTQPLFIVDGVPFMLNGISLAQASLSNTSQSPFNSINPSDIESIEILKDADAISIFGSQGANGVVLITTKKSKSGKPSLDINLYHGIGKATRTIELLNTSQYLGMRREAFLNDGTNPTTSNAPDLLVWDTTRYTDWKQKLIGGTARTTNLQATLTAGNSNLNYLLSANYYKEETVFPGSQPVSRGTVRVNLGHQSDNNKLKINLNSAYSVDIKKFPYYDLTRFINLPPNAPEIYDSTGKLNWVAGFDNPMSYLFRKYNSETNNIIGNLTIDYRLFQGALIKLNSGYNYMQLNEQTIQPIKAQRPSATVRGSSEIAVNNLRSWIVEPQLEYNTTKKYFNFNFLAGASFQQRKQFGNKINATQFTNDDLLDNLAAAGQISATNSSSQYNYAAVFGRIKANFKNKYIINLNGRRDGSSRFGPSKRFSNFGSIGAAWIFLDASLSSAKHRFLNFGKLRFSYGSSGNDQIGDYQYLDAWSSLPILQYQGISGILPIQLYNLDYSWERTKKLEVALNISLLRSKINFTTAYFRNKSDNQLVYSNLPTQTGFNFVLQNLNATIQNSGLEFDLSLINLERNHLKWITNLNLSVPSNKLIAYPDLENSSDKYNFIIGESLDAIYGLVFDKVDPVTGVYKFIDINKDGMISSPGDLTRIGRIGVDYYGGISNSFTWKTFELDFLFEYRKQTGRSYLTNTTTRPGSMGNQPVYVLERWRDSGDIKEIQRFTTTSSSPAFRAYNNLRNSSAVITDASFIRLKNLAISYSIPSKNFSKIKMRNLKFYIHAQNLLTVTDYKGSDPETQNILTLPPIRNIVFGIQITL